MKRKSKEIEYEDSPSGTILLYNYKEPFMEFYDSALHTGYGFVGALAEDSQTGFIQCHFCGEWCNYLPAHLHKEHNMTANAYKERVGLRKSSVLISEKTREKLIVNRNPNKMANLQVQGAKTEETKNKIRETLLRNELESKNEKGTCPLQLIDRLKKLAQEKGRIPKNSEIGFKGALVRTYGSLWNAYKVAGFEVSKCTTNMATKTREAIASFTMEDAKDIYIQYHTLFNRYPTLKNLKNLTNHGRSSDNSRKIVSLIKSKGLGLTTLSKLIKELGVTNIIKSIHSKTKPDFEFTKKEIKDTYIMFKKTHNRPPSISDCRRGVFVHPSKIYYYYKNMNQLHEECSN